MHMKYCGRCVRCRGRKTRSIATENPYNPAELDALFKLTVVIIISQSFAFVPFPSDSKVLLRVVGALFGEILSN